MDQVTGGQCIFSLVACSFWDVCSVTRADICSSRCKTFNSFAHVSGSVKVFLEDCILDAVYGM